MKTLFALTPRQSVLTGSEDFVVNLTRLSAFSEAEAKEFLESNVLTSGMEELAMQVFDRTAGGPSRGIFKLSEAMGGGKTQSMLVTGILARMPGLVSEVPFKKKPKIVSLDAVVAFTGRATDKTVWCEIGAQLGAAFREDRAPSEQQWADALKGRSVIILLDELAFYLVHAASIGRPEDGARFANLTSIALTNLFGAVRDFKECSRVALVVSDLQKDWDQGQESLAQIMRTNVSLGGTIQSADNEMSKGAVTIAPVDNSKDELYAILRKRLFSDIGVSEQEKKEVVSAYVQQLEIAKQGGLLNRSLATIKEELTVSYPFHFSTKHLVDAFNDNPGFQKTRDVIRLMAAIIRGLWAGGEVELKKHHLLSLASADLNDAHVSARFREIKRSLESALQTDIANSGTSFAEALDRTTNGLATVASKWIYAASLSEMHARGLLKEELAEYMAAPGLNLSDLGPMLEELGRDCWYIEQTRNGRYYFNRVQNLNAQINTYVKICEPSDRDDEIGSKLREMFEPRQRRCFQKAEILSDLAKVHLEREKVTLVVCQPETDIRPFFDGEKFKNRVAFLVSVDPSGVFRIRKHAERLWAIRKVLKDKTPEDAQFSLANTRLIEFESELFLAIRSVYAKLVYPLIDQETGETGLAETPLLDSYEDEATGHVIKYQNKDAAKGEFVIEATLRAMSKYQTFDPKAGQDKLKAFQSLRNRVETFLFPPTGRATWEQILDAAASRGHMIWTEPGTMDRMKEVLVTAGQWRQEAGQLLKPPFEEITGVSGDYVRDGKTGRITTTDVKLTHADELYVEVDGAPEVKISPDSAFESDGMSLVFRAKDSKGKNKEGRPWRIENSIEIHYDILPGVQPGTCTLKVKVVPPDAALKFTIDGSDPANNGKSYAAPGIVAPAGCKVKLYASKAAISRELSVSIAKDGDDGGDGDGGKPGIDPDRLAILDGRSLKLTTRKDSHTFLSNLPADARLVVSRIRIAKPETDTWVAMSWDLKTQLDPQRVIAALEYLDGELADGEWAVSLQEVHFAKGSDLIKWQINQSVKLEPGVVRQ